MRFTLFRRLMQQVRAVYYADAPLFAFDEGIQPLVPGLYGAEKEDAQIRFDSRDTHYVVSGSASPETVTLIPVPAHEDFYIFQQSDGGGIAFYGALRLTTDRPGFDLFSPEGDAAAALGAAVANGATPGISGYRFTTAAQLLAALVPVALEAPAAAWNRYYLV